MPPNFDHARNPSELISELVDDPAISIAFPALLKGYTRKEDVQNVKSICQNIVAGHNADQWQRLFKIFYDHVCSARETMPESILRRDAKLQPDWHEQPWYLLYVHRTWCADDASHAQATFDDIRAMLPYIKNDLGFSNICLLPHYESPMADGGYDVSAYTTRQSLGGEEAFTKFMHAAMEMDVRVATDAVFNHTSTEHEWFQKALAGEEKYIAYYVQRNGREKIGEWNRNGDIICRYRDPDGTITERIVVFPDVDRTHGLWVQINSKTYQFYRSFFPFQVDLNLQNPDVLDELLQILSREVKQGVLGKRMDAVAHWVKQPGSPSEGLPQCHAVQALFKSFLRHISPSTILIPEVVRGMQTLVDYAGIETTVNGKACPSQGDALISFEMQAALRESTYFQTIAPFWHKVFQCPDLPRGAVWLNSLEHHDETYMGYFAPEVRQWLAEYITSHGGIVYKNGMSAGGRYADCLENNADRLATAIFLLFMCPGTPLIYSGTEIGACNDPTHAKRQTDVAHRTFQNLGVYVPESSCFDPRELQRGALRRAQFTTAVAEQHVAVRTLQRLARLRAQRASMRSARIEPLDSGDVGLLCAGRRADGDRPLLCMANLTKTDGVCVVPALQLQQLMGIDGVLEGGLAGRRLVDVLTGEQVQADVEAASVRVKLSAFNRAIVEMVE